MSKKMYLIVGCLILLLTAPAVQSSAGVNVNIGVNLPAFAFAAPPAVVLIPGSYVYYVPDASVDILFYHGYWYRPYEGRWYRARNYNGPWGFTGRAPRPLLDLPRDYRGVPPGRQHIPYGHLKKNWGRWERERYWDKHDEWKEDRRERHEEMRERRRDERREDRHGRGEDRGEGRGRRDDR